MKNNPTFTTWLFKPFTYIAGAKALAHGIIILILLSVLGYLSETHFDGILDIHLAGCAGSGNPYIIHVFYQLSTWIILTGVYYITARIASKSETRLIDIAGTMALSQVPLIFAALAGFIPAFHLCITDLNTIMEVLKENIIPIAISTIIFVVFTIWSVILKYNAYSVSANLKGAKAWISFGLALFVCEIVSKIAIYLVVPLLK